MSEQNFNNKRKSKLILITMIAIIAVLFAGIIYQFVVIKKLEKQISNSSASYSVVLEESNTSLQFDFLK